ncbi:MAG: type II secretion system F family protein [Sedimentisphaerales bacterium]|nr:type II secretion system F family protein [Sedimentisphaerales bacterium]
MKSVRALLYQNLANLLEAGLPLLRALESASSGIRGKMARRFGSLAETIHDGSSLADAMRQHPRNFGRLDVIAIEVGETSGQLPQVLGRLADWYRFRRRLRDIILSGLMLPGLLVHAAAFLVPLPPLIIGQTNGTQYVIAVVRTLLPLYLVIVAIAAIRRFTPETGVPRRIIDGIMLRVPVLGRGLRDLALSRYCRAFGLMLSAGVSGVRAAELATECAGNAAVARRVGGAAESAGRGGLFCEGFAANLPVEFLASWRIGEETGNLDKTSGRLGDLYAESAETALKEFARWLPRIVYFLVMLWMAAAVLRLAAGTLVPQLP